MKKTLEIIRNNSNIVWGIVAIIILIFLFLMGRKAGISKIQKEKSIRPLPDGGKTLGDWGRNGKTVEEISYSIAKELDNVLDGVWVVHPVPSKDKRLIMFNTLNVLLNDQVVSVYNQFQLNFASKVWGLYSESLTQQLENEIMPYGGDIRDKAVARLKSLKLN